jgi:hypothetical protein
MAIKVTEEKIDTVQQKHPVKINVPASVPPNAAKVTSWYRKGKIQPWFQPVEDWDAVNDELVRGDFIQNHDIEFASEKGETPMGTKVYYLTEGVYMGKVFADADDEKGKIVFYAVTNKGKLREISGDQASELAAEANGKTFQPKARSETPENSPEN